jgi:hypothetical protein
MPRVAPVVPDESDLLCEGCGYILNNLPTSGNCPECGKPIEQSVGEHRGLSAFEQHPSTSSFIDTTLAVIFRPTHFFRTLATRSHSRGATTFANIHLAIGCVLFFAAAGGHLRWLLQTIRFPVWLPPGRSATAFMVLGFPLLILIIFALTKLATWLSAIEARYWGMRLPYSVVGRGLQFHTAHYLPVGSLAAMVVWGYQALLEARLADQRLDEIYLYTLCGVVVLSASYLFGTYWIAMRNMMFANR